MSKTDIYNSKEYIGHNPTWHEEDSVWKAEHVRKILEKHNIAPSSVAEVGSGFGGILQHLSKYFPDTRFTGYEISKIAYDESVKKESDSLKFRLANLMDSSNRDYFNVLLMMDVFEHVEDYFFFIRQALTKADYVVFHIPLDMSVQTVFRMNVILQAREKLGHLHYFSKDTALATIKDCGGEIIHFHYTDGFAIKNSLITSVMNLPRRFFGLFSKDFSVRLFGGSSLLVLAKRKK